MVLGINALYALRALDQQTRNKSVSNSHNIAVKFTIIARNYSSFKSKLFAIAEKEYKFPDNEPQFSIESKQTEKLPLLVESL